MTRAYWFEHKEQGAVLATDNRNYQPGVLRLNIAPIGSVIPKNPGSSTAFKSVERQVGYRHCHAAILHYKKCRFRGDRSQYA